MHPAIWSPRSWRPWTPLLRKARVHALIVAVVLWTAALVTGFAGESYRSIAGPLKAADFVQFYTMGYLARTGQAAAMYDIARQHAAQGQLVPESADLTYPPVYPPQTALIFVPLSFLSYGQAALLWTLVTVGLYGFTVRIAWMSVRSELPDGFLVGAAAAAFPPFWQLVLHGQTTAILLVAFGLGWLALERRRAFLAGCAFGLLAFKPQFGLPLAVVVVARRDWHMLAGAVASVAAQTFVVWVVLGPSVFGGFQEVAWLAVSYADLLEARPFQSHSIRALTRLAPGWLPTASWAITSLVVLAFTARAWQTVAPVALRLSVVIIASVLVNPHLIVYDATVLALPLMWLSAHYASAPSGTSWYWALLYGLYVTLLAPTAYAIGLQLSVVLMICLFAYALRAVKLHSTSQPHPGSGMAPA